ncbi:NAD(P)-binding protein [Gonapodya prolifera JEL478]|uniref:NAD(P)-binding protein n=1 Tax=Gonapodya prolifera (strain JEL478) TaxID=1344416 RepID=A0A139A1I3_GONPJ|nr:NAD(P)-binding protein [Gonapodya prolifera JEL478]|eukprot:KXS10601.1 NAD(P)-binding protein [Gonapodya prolifera JEL478]
MAATTLKTLGTRLINQSTGKGRVCLVTGSASKGMGRAFVLSLAKEGGLVEVSDIPKREKEGHEGTQILEKTSFPKCDGRKSIWVPLDVTKEEAWKAAVSDGVLDVLVNNAGIVTPHDATAVQSKQISLAELHKSTNAGMVGGVGTLGYGTSKWAHRGLTKYMAGTLPAAGIRARVSSVRFIRTEMIRGVGLVDQNSDDVIGEIGNALANMNYLKRSAGPEEVANLVVFFASDESSFSTGSEFLVDGRWQ